jgi:endonuclease/exonuclease/phosphatase family metal-dependent hydrolase
MQFSVVFWNIWLDTQRGGTDTAVAKTLLRSLDKIVQEHNPDCLGLNEVLVESATNKQFVLEHLKKMGYTHQAFSYASPLSPDWGIGLALVSKHPFKKVEEIDLGPDTFAKYRGYAGYRVSALGATISVKGSEVNVMVAHPHALKPIALPTHWKHQRALRTAAKAPHYTQLILGGDFNEFNHLPFSFQRREKNHFYFRSGSATNPTWTLNGKGSKLFRCNLDKIFWTKEESTKLLEFQVLDSSPSDHAPLLGRFLFQ